MFVGIRALRPDPEGLTFRHDRGAARVSWDRLSEGDARRLGAPAARPDAAGGEPPAPPAVPAGHAAGQGGAAAPLRVDFRFRTTVVLPTATCPWAAGDPVLPAIAWPAYWARPRLGLAYPFFPWRQLAERDFLITTGILPRPPGVVTRPLRIGRY